MEYLSFVLILACGAFIGFIFGCAARPAETGEESDFDGGFRAEHPRVTTIIYSPHVQQKDSQ